jgi:hypothetical protein
VAAYPLVSLILTSTTDEVALDRETSDGGEHVAAVRRCVDSTLRDRNLRKQVVDVRVLTAAGPDDKRLAGQRVAAADAIDLPNIGRAHERQQEIVASACIARQIGRDEQRTFRCTPRMSMHGTATLSMRAARNGECVRGLWGHWPDR